VGRQRGAAHQHGDVRLRRRAREREVALVGRHRGAAHGRDAERRVVGASEELRLLRARRSIDEHPRHEGELVPDRAIGAQRRAGLHAAGAVAENGTRQHAPGGVLEIFQRQDVFELHYSR
jgi:hypothetical protein